MFASKGILVNHKSPLPGETLVTGRITNDVAAVELGLENRIYFGNIVAKRD
jgi:GDP-D-mannose dehydratase